MTEVQLSDSCNAGALQPSRAISESCGEFHVLAVDDSTSDRRIVEKLLQRLSYKVTTAKNAIHALQILGLDDRQQESEVDSKFNLIITDYSMPGMSGGELLRRIKDAASFRKVPVIIMSSEDISSRKKKCLDEGAEDYLIKPLRVNDMLKINCLMKRSEQIFQSGSPSCEHSSMSVGILLSGEDCEGKVENLPTSLESKSLKLATEKREIEQTMYCTDGMVVNGIPKRTRLMRYTTI